MVPNLGLRVDLVSQPLKALKPAAKLRNPPKHIKDKNPYVRGRICCNSLGVLEHVVAKMKPLDSPCCLPPSALLIDERLGCFPLYLQSLMGIIIPPDTILLIVRIRGDIPNQRHAAELRGGGEGERERGREGERERGREGERERGREGERERGREGERERGREGERESGRVGERERGREGTRPANMML